MKTAVLALLIAFALASNAHAFLRPRFPHRTYPPAGGDWISGAADDSIRQASAPAPAPR